MAGSVEKMQLRTEEAAYVRKEAERHLPKLRVHQELSRLSPGFSIKGMMAGAP